MKLTVSNGHRTAVSRSKAGVSFSHVQHKYTGLNRNGGRDEEGAAVLTFILLTHLHCYWLDDSTCVISSSLFVLIFLVEPRRIGELLFPAACLPLCPPSSVPVCLSTRQSDYIDIIYKEEYGVG